LGCDNTYYKHYPKLSHKHYKVKILEIGMFELDYVITYYVEHIRQKTFKFYFPCLMHSCLSFVMCIHAKCVKAIIVVNKC
jgi:hypothetical protein